MKKIRKNSHGTSNKKFQPIPFFIALGFALPIHTATVESDPSSYPLIVKADSPLPHVVSQTHVADRRPARVANQISNTQKLLGMNLKMNESALSIPARNWNMDEKTIDLLYFQPENTAPTLRAEINVAQE